MSGNSRRRKTGIFGTVAWPVFFGSRKPHRAIASPRLVLLYAAFILAGLIAHTTFALMPANPILGGGVIDTDGYMHMVRAQALYETGDWYDNVIDRVNAPYGLALHWTRVVDVLLMIFALPLTLLAEFPRALHWAALPLGPLAHIAAACAVAWAARPVIPSAQRLWALPVFFFQGQLLIYSWAGAVDHHGLLVLMAALSIGSTLRLLQEPRNHSLGVLCGAIHGSGLWLSPEFFLIIALDLSAFGLLWARRGDFWNSSALRLCLGALLSVAIYLPVERPLSDLFRIEHDRISVVHFVYLVIASGVWALSYWQTIGVSQVRRWSFLGVSFCIGLVILFLIFPEFYRGPMAGIDPRIYDLLISQVVEMKPLLRFDLVGLRESLWAVGGAIVAMPFAIWVLLRERFSKNHILWILLFVYFVVMLTLGLAHARLSIYAEIPIAIFLAELLRRVSNVLATRVRNSLRILIMFYAAMLLGLGPLVASGEVRKAEAASRPVHEGLKKCQREDVVIAADYAVAAMKPERPTILTDSMNYGPTIVYFTPAAVISAPYHRNVRGVLDAHKIWNAEDAGESFSILVDRGVDYLLLCTTVTPENLDAAGRRPRTFYSRVKEGRDLPDWLVPVALETNEAVETGVRLFSVLR